MWVPTLASDWLTILKFGFDRVSGHNGAPDGRSLYPTLQCDEALLCLHDDLGQIEE